MVSSTMVAEEDRQDIRLAVVLNGGVSLAIWISGVALEMHDLVQASRTPAAKRAANPYAALLDVLQARVRIDVISGTSAGGLNGGFLALGVSRGCDLRKMRDLWSKQGGLAAMLRDPREKQPASLLDGQYFLSCLQQAYRTIHADDSGCATEEPVELYLTGTLWDGRRSPFTDQLGRRIVEVDHDAIFHFTSTPRTAVGDLSRPSVAEELAVASRCTSSFPGAFEPVWVSVGEASGARWKSSAGLSNFSTSQYVVDGGVLLNKPIRPALEAVYRQSGAEQIRRIMAYVVPDAGSTEHETAAASSSPDAPPVPRAPEVLLGVATRLRSSDSVAVQLAEIEQQNVQSHERRRSRDRLAAVLEQAADAPQLVEAAYPAYREVRVTSAARTVAAMMNLQGSPRGWSAREIEAVIQEIGDSRIGLPYVPQKVLQTALDAGPDEWSWGQTEVERLGDLVVDVFKRAVWLAELGSIERRAVVAARRGIGTVLTAVRADRERLRRFWADEGQQLPERDPKAVASAPELATLRDQLVAAHQRWELTEPGVGGRRRDLRSLALELAREVRTAAATLLRVAGTRQERLDPKGDEGRRLRQLVTALVGDATTDEQVLQRMLRLQVLQVAVTGVLAEVEQEVELVQVSSDTPELLNGVQMHHFGAFYRQSWRCNDWLRGRLDGATQLVQMLLAPERLRQLGFTAETAFDALRGVGCGDDAEYAKDLRRDWDQDANQLRKELQVLDGQLPLPRTFPLVARAIARRIHAQLLPEELAALASGVEAEPDPLAVSARWARRASQLRKPSLAQLEQLNEDSEFIGGQRITAEAGKTDSFAQVTSQGAATLVSVAVGLRKPRVVASVLSALRGYALLVWLLVGSMAARSNVGRNAVSLALGVGGALLGLTLVLPGMPVAVTLLGVLLLLGAASAVALTGGKLLHGMGWRLVVLLVLVLAALAGNIAWTVTRGDRELVNTLLTGAGRVGVVVAVVLAGWFLARARPAPVKDEPADAPSASGTDPSGWPADATVPQPGTGPDVESRDPVQLSG